MGFYSVHDSLYAKNGGFLTGERDGGILLKKKYSSVVYCPSGDERAPGAMYPRCICLEHNGERNGTLLASFECYTYKQPVFPIYESVDKAASWHLKSTIKDNEKGFGCRFQPHLYELPVDCGSFPAGTVLCAGNVIPDDFGSTSLHLYASMDAGLTWTYVSEIVSGGTALVDVQEDNRPVWEPFLTVTPEGKLICFYSDEGYIREKRYNQALVHKVSEDGGFTWSEAKIDAAFADGQLRPGMPVIAQIADGRFVMVYEMVNEDRIPVYFRISDSIEDWGDPDFMGNPVVSKDGSYLTGTPYVIWIPKGGEKGTILVTGRGFSHIFSNSAQGEGFWEKMECLIEIDNELGFTGYSQCMVPLDGGRQILSLCPRQISDRLALIEAAVADVYVKA